MCTKNDLKIILDAGSYKDSIGRSYYSMFTAVRALLTFHLNNKLVWLDLCLI